MSTGKRRGAKGEEEESSSAKFRPFFRKLHRHMSLHLASSGPAQLPEDVPEGHFAVLATEGDEAERFVVELGYLTEPAFLKLLEKARDEFGFGQKGALTLPCRPQELQIILQRSQRTKAGASCPTV